MNTISKKAKEFVCLVAIISIVGMAIVPTQATPQKFRSSVKPEMFTGDDVVLQWNQIASDRMPAGAPFPTGRCMSIVQL